MLGKTLRPIIGPVKEDLIPPYFHQNNRQRFISSFQTIHPSKFISSIFLIKGHQTVHTHDTGFFFKYNNKYYKQKNYYY